MIFSYIFPIVIICTLSAYLLGKSRANRVSVQHGEVKALHSLPVHYGVMTALSCFVPAMLVYVFWTFFEQTIIVTLVSRNLPAAYLELTSDQLSLVLNEIKNVAFGGFTANQDNPLIQASADQYLQIRETGRHLISACILTVAFVPAFFAYRSINKDLRARNIIEGVGMFFLIACSAIAILTTLGIVFSVLFEALRFFQSVPVLDFVFGMDWSPQTAMRADQVGSSGAFGAIPVFAGTLLIALIAMTVAIPIGLLSAIYLSEYATATVRTYSKPALEILAGIPTVVYGFFAALTVAPLIRDAGAFFHLTVSSESALAAGLVMGIMIIPFISSLSDDVIHAVPQSLRDGSYGLGATRFETIRHIVIPAALPGIVGSVLLAVSRAIGETMIVVMAAGLSANLTFNPLNAVTTVTVQIVTLLVGDQEFDNPKTLAAFALGLLLFVFTLFLNFIALRVVRKYREQYD